jgi:hypothetical protein
MSSYQYACVLMLVYMVHDEKPHVLILVCMCPHASMHVSSCLLVCMCPHASILDEKPALPAGGGGLSAASKASSKELVVKS